MAETKVARKNKNMVSRVIADETILLPIYKSSDDINCIYTLNTAAAWVWELIDGKRTLGQIKKKALEVFDSSETEIEQRLEKVFAELHLIHAIE